jgi:hypothetical protein
MTVYAQALRRLEDGIYPVLYLLDDDGEVLEAAALAQPTVVWYPPQRWSPGETVRLIFNTIPWNTKRVDGYRLALGFIRGEDPWAIEQRLAPTLSGGQADPERIEESLVILVKVAKIWGVPSVR